MTRLSWDRTTFIEEVQSLKEAEERATRGMRDEFIGRLIDNLDDLTACLWELDKRSLIEHATEFVTSGLVPASAGDDEFGRVLFEIEELAQEKLSFERDPKGFTQAEMQHLRGLPEAFYGPLEEALEKDLLGHFWNKVVTAIGEAGAPEFLAKCVRVAFARHGLGGGAGQQARLRTMVLAMVDSAATALEKNGP